LKNIVITGPIGAGKSTVIRRLILECSLEVAGFMTLPVFESGRRIGFVLSAYDSEKKDGPFREASFIGRFNEENRLLPHTEAFETLGVEIIEEAQKKSGILVFDEVGFLERDAGLFQRSVMACLDREDLLVIMALKEREGVAFLDRIRSHDKTRLFTINPLNREAVFTEIADYYRRGGKPVEKS
jgi:nucleoside-triphosphatase THEP1